MIINCFTSTCAKNGIPIMNSFIESLKKDSINVLLNEQTENFDCLVIWNMLLNHHVRKQLIEKYYGKKPIIVLEVGGLVRNVSWKVAINGINRDANFANNVNDPYQRLYDVFKLKDQSWKKQGDYILITTQNENSFAWKEGNMVVWVENLIKEIKKHTDRKILLRPHPRFEISSNLVEINHPKKIGNYDETDLKDIINKSHCVINYNSNPGIDSVLSGTPLFCHESSLSYDVSNKFNFHNIENLEYPNKDKWIPFISHTEWLQEEIEKGIPWQRIKQQLVKYL